MFKHFEHFTLSVTVVNRAGIHKMLVRIANREDPDQIASSEVIPSEAVWSGCALFVKDFWQATSVWNFELLFQKLAHIFTLC